ncbi:hypothetical protein [uncultured Aquimarina sp.]|uniref:hypothetical protein n=1 Tax=uncultured Aquimarina sp. TaxID=575652 RepID=UPI002610F628|nr:hypothetical protein [uncultured Aquimarina sp.]
MKKFLRTTLKLSLLLTLTFFYSCDEDEFSSDDDLTSILPEELFSYQITFFNTTTVSNPGNLAVASQVTYRFISSSVVQGSSELNTLPTESWTYTNNSTGGVFDAASIFLNYGSALGTEQYEIEFDGTKEDPIERLTFTYFGNLQGNPTVQTTGHFEIQQIN